MIITDEVDAVLPAGEWRVLTCFDTLVCYDLERGEFRHGEVHLSPRNVAVVQSPEGTSIKVGSANLANTEGVTQTISVRNAGLQNNVAFYRYNGLMTALPDGSVAFGTRWLRTWEVFRLVREDYLNSDRYWMPSAPLGGTELMLDQLRRALGKVAEGINLQLNSLSSLAPDPRPIVVWFQNEPGHPIYRWCRDLEQVTKVARFVFVSQWQRQQFVEMFSLPPERCEVIRNAIETSQTNRPWPAHSKWRWRCAYISAPFRGLNVLLDAWQELSPTNAELHIWSGLSLWAIDNSGFRYLYSRAMETPNVIYHRVAPNATIRAALADMNFLLYPCTYDETFCISMVEAMSAGCRVIASSRAALPETAAGFARLYPFVPDHTEHKRAFLHALADELAQPWGDRLDLAEAQQVYCRLVHDWTGRVREWRHLIGRISGVP